jgi:ankyrin repeat protein
VYYLLDKIADRKACKASNMYDGRTVLHLAAAENDLKLCKKLVQNGANVNALMKATAVSLLFFLMIYIFDACYF